MNVKLYRFLDRAGFFLLYAFVASLLINPFIVLWVGREKFTYQYAETPYNGAAIFNASHKPIEIVRAEERTESALNWLGLTALLGWCVTSPRFLRGAARDLKKLKKYFPD